MRSTKDQIKKLSLSAIGFVFLLYVYFTFFLGPLNRSRDGMLLKIKDLQSKLDSSKEEMTKAVKLEQRAKTSTSRFAALKAFNPEGAPIAWFPPRIRAFFADQQIDKAVARLEGSSGFKQVEWAFTEISNHRVKTLGPRTDWKSILLKSQRPGATGNWWETKLAATYYKQRASRN